MSSRAQKERIGSLNIKDKKLTRLFHNKNITKNDSFILNYAYEEKQNLNFFYGLGVNTLICVTLNFVFFKNNRKLFQMAFFLSTFAGINLTVRNRLEGRYNDILTPYFEKYQVK